MSLAALARQMHDAGTPIEGIILALEAVEARDNAAAAKRAQAAARKQAQRDRERDSHATITGHDADIPLAPPSLDKSPPDPQKLIPTPPVHIHEARARAVAWPCPDDVDPAHWKDFLAARKRKRMVTTQTALDGVLSDIANLTSDDWPPGKLVQLAAAKGWGSINLPDGYQNGRSTRNGMAGSGKPAGRTSDGFTNAIRDARAIREAVPWDANDASGIPRLAGLG